MQTTENKNELFWIYIPCSAYIPDLRCCWNIYKHHHICRQKQIQHHNLQIYLGYCLDGKLYAHRSVHGRASQRHSYGSRDGILQPRKEEMGIKQTLALHFYSSRSYLARYRTYEVRYSFNSPPLPCNRKHVCGIELLLSE